MSGQRLDLELVARGLARSRAHASQLIGSGLVDHAGRPAAKASAQVGADDRLHVRMADVVSRGALKLSAALDELLLDVRGRRALDVGASTGGFTQTLLRRGTEHVVALDVGHDQIVAELRSDARVTVIERRNVRTLVGSELPYAPDLVVADVSFISLTHVLPAIVGVAAPHFDAVVLVKPQFELAGPGGTDHGVVTDARLRADAVRRVVRCALGLGLGIRASLRSAHAGARGNLEYFLWLEPGSEGVSDATLVDLTRE